MSQLRTFVVVWVFCMATVSCSKSPEPLHDVTHVEVESPPTSAAPEPSTESDASVTAVENAADSASDAAQAEPTANAHNDSSRLDRKDLTPEDAVRLFLVAIATNDEEILRAVALPMDGIEILLQGEGLPPERQQEYLAEVRSLKLRRLALNETIFVPGGGNVTMDTVRVNEDRVQLTHPGNAIPFDVLRAENGYWWVNPEHVIAARRAARAAREKSKNP